MIPARVIVINLARRTDRLEAFHRRWATAGGAARVEVLEATDRPDAPAAAAFDSHLRALRAGDGPVLILEDDAVFTDAFRLDLPEPPRHWRLLRLGGWLRRRPPIDAVWLPVSQISGTHAYVARNPLELADHIVQYGVADIGAVLFHGILGHYRLARATVGQAAGASDIRGYVRTTDAFWDDL